MTKKKENNKDLNKNSTFSPVSQVSSSQLGNHYERDLEHIQGNAFTGEQISVAQTYQTDNPLTHAEMETHWEEMRQQAKSLREQYPDEVVFVRNPQVSIHYDNNGSQVIRHGNQGTLNRISVGNIASNERIQIPIYDEHGNQITGYNNIRNEVKRREAEWERWERNGQLQETQETYVAGDGRTFAVKFRGIPGQMHPQIPMRYFLPIAGLNEEETQGAKRQNETDVERSSQEGSKKSRTSSPVEVDKPESDEYKNFSRKQLIDEINWLKGELEKANYSENEATSSKQLEAQLFKAESALDSFQGSSSNNKNENTNGVVASIAGVSVVLIAGVVWVKNRLFSKKK